MYCFCVLSSAALPQKGGTLDQWKFCVHADKRSMLKDLTSELSGAGNGNGKDSSVGEVLCKLAATIAAAISANTWNVHVVDESDKSRIVLLADHESFGEK